MEIWGGIWRSHSTSGRSGQEEIVESDLVRKESTNSAVVLHFAFEGDG